ncbi:restriction endonuclease subunit S [Limosilactobacillus mucosae]|uniref:restriction endonuclease subunit S n=3 Tax=Limosilactobacillus mucosae TaxID=97478 RepID=UPI003EBC11E0
MAKQSPSYHFAPGDTVSAAGKHSQPYPWEQRKLGEIAEEVKGNSGSINNIPILTISAANGWMNQKDRFSQIIAGNELKKYTLLKKGELSYNHGNSKLAKYGTVFVQDSHDKALVPRVYHSFKMVAQNNPYFIEYLFASGLPNKELSKIVTSGARMDGLLNINKKEFFSIKLNNPSSEEQSSVAKLFQSLDKTITLHEEQHRQLEQLKKALLQKMFADETGYPALRFKGFTEKWEQRKLGETVVNIVAGGDINKAELLSKGKYPVYANALTNNGIVGYYASQYRIAAPAVTVTGRGDIGIAKARDINFTPVVRLLAISSQHNNYFLENLINTHRSFAESTGVPQLTVPQLSNYKLYFPQKINEEVFIGKLFKKMDHLTTLHQHKIDNLKRLKRALLQKMFV